MTEGNYPRVFGSIFGPIRLLMLDRQVRELYKIFPFLTTLSVYHGDVIILLLCEKRRYLKVLFQPGVLTVDLLSSELQEVVVVRHISNEVDWPNINAEKKKFNFKLYGDL